MLESRFTPNNLDQIEIQEDQRFVGLTSYTFKYPRMYRLDVLVSTGGECSLLTPAI